MGNLLKIYHPHLIHSPFATSRWAIHPATRHSPLKWNWTKWDSIRFVCNSHRVYECVWEREGEKEIERERETKHVGPDKCVEKLNINKTKSMKICRWKVCIGIGLIANGCHRLLWYDMIDIKGKNGSECKRMKIIRVWMWRWGWWIWGVDAINSISGIIFIDLWSSCIICVCMFDKHNEFWLQ